jgi:hypothetical protein
MDGRRGDGRLLVNNKNGWAWLIVGLLLLLLLMSAQVDGTVYVRLRIHHALPNLFRVNNQNKAFFFNIRKKRDEFIRGKHSMSRIAISIPQCTSAFVG